MEKSVQGWLNSGVRTVVWSVRNVKTALQVFIKSTAFFTWWVCLLCGHEFEETPGRVTNERWKGNGCFCTGKKRKVCGNKECDKGCFERSFASFKGLTPIGNRVVDCWDTSKNDGLTPYHFAISAGSKCFFVCDKCGHSLQHSLDNLTCLDRWCKYCERKELCDKSTCEPCHQASFASFDGCTPSGKKVVDCWDASKNNGLMPRDVFKSSNDPFHFLCDCGHAYESQLNNVSSGYWCGYCSSPPKNMCPDDVECDSCFRKSFAHLLQRDSEYGWSADNNIGAPSHRIFAGSGVKVRLVHTVCGSVFDIIACNFKSGARCSHCKRKTETKVFNLLSPLFSTLERNIRPVWALNDVSGRCLEFDLFLLLFKIVIEIDGAYHYRQVWNWNTAEAQKRDRWKEERAQENGFRVIRLLQEDVWYDEWAWFPALKTKIQYLIEHPEEPFLGYLLHSSSRFFRALPTLPVLPHTVLVVENETKRKVDSYFSHALKALKTSHDEKKDD